jgi:hypothetical protein
MHDPEQDVHLGSPDETHERHGGYEKLHHDCDDVSETRIETNAGHGLLHRSTSKIMAALYICSVL